MRKITLISFLFLLLYASITYGNHHKVHIHGEASGFVAINKSSVLINLDIPALSVVGFEHFPESEKEKELIRQAIKLLEKPKLITLFKNKGILRKNKEIVPVKVERDVQFTLKDDKGKHDDHHDKHHKSHNEVQDKKHGKGHKHHHSEKAEVESHAEFKVTLSYKLKNNITINKLSTELFSRVPSLKKLNLSIVTDEQQFQYTLSERDTVIKIDRK